MNGSNQFINLSNFTKKSKIGEGTFGEVFTVAEEKTGNIYAAKISKSQLKEDDKSFTVNLQREVDINAQLNHPCILKFIGYSPTNFTNDPNPVIISEYASNGTLLDYIQKERLSLSPKSWDDTKKLINIYGIASAMSYLHSHNIIHRDLKPANILEDDFLFPKISDFGLSKSFHQNVESMTAQSTLGVKGTPIYIPPEGWETNEYTKSGDVYAFAIIVYELITLEEPFKDFTMFMICSKVTYKGQRPEFKFPVPDCYHQLITRCWAQDPNERLTFDEIVQELKTNREFITDSVDEDEFLDFVDLVDNYRTTFDPSKKFKKITFSEKIVEEEEPQKVESKKEEKQKREKVVEPKQEKQKREKVVEPKQEQKKKQKQQKKKKTILLSSSSSSDFPSDFPSDDDDNNDDINNESDSDKSDYDDLPFDDLDIDPTATTIKSFHGNDKIKKVAIPSSVTSLDRGTFRDCTKLKYITLPPSLNKITVDLFSGCSNLRRIEIPPLVSDISMNAFLECKKLREVVIPSKVTRIMNSAFEGCSNLVKVTISSSVKQICNSAFIRCTSLKEVIFEDTKNLTQIDRRSFMDCSSLQTISIPSSVKQIGEYVFANCSCLSNLIIPSSVKQIGEYAFSHCSRLSKIDFEKPATLAKLGDNTFEYCASLPQIEIPSSVTRICKNCFQDCEKLSNISFEIPSKLVSMDVYIFTRCKLLKQIKLPSSLKSFNEGSFITGNLDEILVSSTLKKSVESNLSLTPPFKVSYYDE